MRGLTILWNGDVGMCKEDFDGRHIVGNARKTPLQDIWYDSLFDLRLLHFGDEWDKIDLCKGCKEWFHP
jgi:radical SAM protein with 4Fe4S-binding SPASM domain